MMRHFAHNIGDYAAATAHLSFVEDAAYHRLLRRYYQDEKPLPPDLATCARLIGARTKEEKQAVANVLTEFFEIEQDGYHQKRADREIAVYHEKADAARRNGTKGGRPPNQNKTNPVIPSVRTEKLTTPQEPLPITNSEAKASGAKAPAREVIFSEGLPWLVRRSGLDDRACRSIIGKWLKEYGDEPVLAAMQQAEQENPVDPVPWIVAKFKPRESWNEKRIRLGMEAIHS